MAIHKYTTHSTLSTNSATESGVGARDAATADSARELEEPPIRTDLLEVVGNCTDTHLAYLDRKMNFAWVNTAYARGCGHTREELMGRNHFELFPNAENQQIFERVRDTGEPYQISDKPFVFAEHPEWGTTYWDWTLTPIRGVNGEVEGLVLSLVDVTARKQAALEREQLVSLLGMTNQRLELLSATASELLLSDDPQCVVQSLCERVMEQLDCHAFFNYVVDEGRGSLRLNACAGIPDDKAREIGWLDYGVAVCGCVARDGCRIVAEDIANTPDPRTELVRSLGIESYACHPLLSRGGKVIGTLSFGSRTRSSFGDADLGLMKTVADHVATAMEKARLLAMEQQRSAELESLILSMADGVCAMDTNGNVTLINEAGRRMLGAGPNDRFGDWWRRFPCRTLDGRPMDPEETASKRALSGVVVRDARYCVDCPDGRVLCVSVSASPIRDAHGAVVGAIGIFRDIGESVEFERRRSELYAREHRIAETLQQVLVPSQIADRLHGYSVASLYQPAWQEAEVGGDFYDVFEVDRNRTGILIGDVAGKGLKAAMRVAAIRYAVRSYAYLDASPSGVLRAANEALSRESFTDEGMFTTFFAVLDTVTGLVRYANGGHEPPVLCTANGMRNTEVTGPVLGMFGGIEFGEASLQLDHGDTLLMVTDGITEARPNSTSLFGRDGMLDYLARSLPASPHELVSRLLEAAKAHAGGSLPDDAALVAIQRV